ncbi:hypothetical protein A2U01_0076471, partial [Trifolium medium]|nr:hypothetical protein [Trifolium medium]
DDGDDGGDVHCEKMVVGQGQTLGLMGDGDDVGGVCCEDDYPHLQTL